MHRVRLIRALPSSWMARGTVRDRLAVLVLQAAPDDDRSGLVGVGGLLAGCDDVGEGDLAFEGRDLSDRIGGGGVGSPADLRDAGAGHNECHEHQQRTSHHGSTFKISSAWAVVPLSFGCGSKRFLISASVFFLLTLTGGQPRSKSTSTAVAAPTISQSDPKT